ncbi:MAG TPA: double zinc ribbon domain-containing protein [Gemmatimonadales bacterium]|nr:double zinc ribbon domain-containing protein [Gemmatimonadales bacterium]
MRPYGAALETLVPAPWRAALRGLERRLMPAECLICQAVLGETGDEPLVCGVCRSRWARVTPPFCARCGQPVLEGVACRICAEWPAALACARSAVWLTGGAREAVHALKYGGWWRVAGSLADAMRGLAPLTGGLSLVPIPLGARRRRARGYNQSERLAQALAERTGGRVADCLGRARETRTQTALAPEQRRANVAGAFRARGPVPARCVLVDDVFTTGATLVAAAEALVAGGATEVQAVTFARAPLPVVHGS